ncbi:hypothetical protein [Salinibacter ruber]|uniref:hypothetical protein n=1 Tax=Salinibacter ruber TaxID=146919 RepID=UPI0020748454|nr:hypothetical protein [Salinibacter ruber]
MDLINLVDLEGPSQFLDVVAEEINGRTENAVEGMIISAGMTSGGAGPGPHETDRLILRFPNFVSEENAEQAVERALANIASEKGMEDEHRKTELVPPIS